MKKLLLFVAVVMAMVGCVPQKKNVENMKKTLVIYYSQTGATEQVAQEFVKHFNADVLRIEAEQPYSGTYQETIERSREERESGNMPKLQAFDVDFAQYDTICLGYPIWFGTYALPVVTLLNENDFSGKVIVPFCTFGSGGTAASINDLMAAQPKADVRQGYGVRNARIAKAPAEVERFLVENGYIAGEIAQLPDYSEQQPVTEAEVEIFNAACGDYQYPLGTPVAVGSRTTADGVDYRYVVSSKDAAGNDVEAIIFVSVSNDPTVRPEFTEVVR